jgi:hypothetical protein
MITNEKLETSFLPLRDPRSARRRRADVTTRETIVVGGRVPADIELESVPTDWVRLLPNIATCIRVTASCWSIRVAGPSFRKSTDAFARSVAP